MYHTRFSANTRLRGETAATAGAHRLAALGAGSDGALLDGSERAVVRALEASHLALLRGVGVGRWVLEAVRAEVVALLSVRVGHLQNLQQTRGVPMLMMYKTKP